MKHKLLIMAIFVILLLSSCSGVGSNKRTTVVPDSIGISVGRDYYFGEVWDSVSLDMTWYLE